MYILCAGFYDFTLAKKTHEWGLSLQIIYTIHTPNTECTNQKSSRYKVCQVCGISNTKPGG